MFDEFNVIGPIIFAQFINDIAAHDDIKEIFQDAYDTFIVISDSHINIHHEYHNNKCQHNCEL